MVTHIQINEGNYYRKTWMDNIAVKEIMNEHVMNGNYVNNGNAVEQKHTEMQILHKNMF